MKFLFLILACLAAAQASILGLHDRTTTMDKTTGDDRFWVRQLAILKLFNHYTMPNANTEQYTIAKNFKLDTLFDKIEDKEIVKVFMLKWRQDTFLDKYHTFSVTNKYHRDDVRLIVDIFNGLKDFDTFYEFACWVREYMNRGMFLYALTVTMLNRVDLYGMRIPAMYEIVPNKFFNDEVIEIAKNIKMQGRIFNVKDGERLGVRKVHDRTFLIESLYSCWMVATNEECKMTYFTEDVGLNNRYYILNALKPFWMHTTRDIMPTRRRGEYFLFIHQQLLNRYYMERLSNDLGDIPEFSYDLPIIHGVTSTLKHFNGLIMPSRPNDYLVKTVGHIWDVKRVKDYERRLRDAVDKGFIVLDDGKTLHLNRPEDIELLGNLIQSNTDSPNRNFFLNGLLIAKKLLGNNVETTHRMFSVPGILEQYETALRDPMFWQLWKRIYRYVEIFKSNLRPYTLQEVSFDGVTVTDIKTDRLETFFDVCDSDISNVVNRDEEEMRRNHDKFIFIARQHCLNHRKFNVEIDYTSDKTTDAVVRIFLGPKFDSMGTKTFLGRRFLLIDNFFMTLKTGSNTIRRDSTTFWNRVRDTMTYTAMLKKVEHCTTSECDLDTVEFKYGFPNRLVLPRGKVEGMTFKLFVSITPLVNTKTFDKFLAQDPKAAMLYMNDMFRDDRSLGYPLDRDVDWTVFTQCTNMKMTDVKIYHDMRTDYVMNRRMHLNTIHKDFRTDRFDKDFRMDRTGRLDKDIRMDYTDRMDHTGRMDKDYRMDHTGRLDKDFRMDYTDRMDRDFRMDHTGRMDKDYRLDTGRMDKDYLLDHTIRRDKDLRMDRTGYMDKDYFTVVNKDKDFMFTKTGKDMTIDKPWMTKTKTDKDFSLHTPFFSKVKTDKDILIDSPFMTNPKHIDFTFTHDRRHDDTRYDTTDSKEVKTDFYHNH